MYEPKYKVGQLVRLAISNRSYTDDGLQTVGTYNISDFSCGLLYAKVDVCSYPSCSDFYGDTSVVKNGEVATIVSYLGRPFKISTLDIWEHYDIYEVLISGNVRCVFSYNLEPSPEYFKKI